MNKAKWKGTYEVCDAISFYDFYKQATGTDFEEALASLKNNPNPARYRDHIVCMYVSMRRAAVAELRGKPFSEIADELETRDVIGEDLSLFLNQLLTGKKAEQLKELALKAQK